MIKVTALTSGRDVPSSRFRVRQFIAPLSQFGIQVSEYPLPVPKYTRAIPDPFGFLVDSAKAVTCAPGLLHSRSSDITWLERERIPRRSMLERFAGGKRLLDVDDAIWLTDSSNFSENIAASCYGVIAGNEFLADHYRTEGNKTWVVPTSIDTEMWRPSTRTENGTWTVGWIGSSSNLPFLYEVEEPLANFLAEHSDTELLIVSDSQPSFRKIPNHSLRFEPWSREREVELVQQMDVGLMPLPDTKWTQGKCALKMISYMAVGLPVVVSPFGVSKELLGQGEIGLAAVNLNDWYNSLRALYYDRKQGADFGAAGRRVVLDRYSVATNVSLLANIFQEVAKMRTG